MQSVDCMDWVYFCVRLMLVYRPWSEEANFSRWLDTRQAHWTTTMVRSLSGSNTCGADDGRNFIADAERTTYSPVMSLTTTPTFILPGQSTAGNELAARVCRLN